MTNEHEARLLAIHRAQRMRNMPLVARNIAILGGSNVLDGRKLFGRPR